MKTVLFLIVSLFVLPVFSDEENPASILKKSDLRRGLQDSFFVRVKTVSYDGPEKQNHVYDVKVLDKNVSLVEQVEPATAKGRKLLMKGYDMWLFTPDIKKPVRISLQQKLTGEVQNGDIARTNFAEDYDAQFNKASIDPKYFILDLKAKEPKVTYDQIRYWIEKKSYRPFKAEFFASGGKKLKEAQYGQFKKIDGVERMTYILIVDALNKSKKSELFYSSHKKQKYDEGLFNKEQLIR